MERTAPSRSLSIALAFMAIIWVSPFSWLLVNAFDPAAVGRLAIPQSIGLDNFGKAVSGDAGRQFLNSLLIAAGTATLSVLVGIAAAYPLSRLRIPGAMRSSGRWCCCACCPRSVCWCRSTSRRSAAAC